MGRAGSGCWHTCRPIILNEARPHIGWKAIRGKPLIMKDRRLHLKLVLELSREAEDLQEFVIDLWRWRERIRSGRRAR